MKEQPQNIQILQIDEDSEDEINIRSYLLFLKRKALIILIVTFLIMSLAILYTFFIAKNKYEAKAVLKFPSSGGTGLASALGSFLPIGQTNDLSTEIEIMKGRHISESVINELRLNEKPEYSGLDQNQILIRFQENLKIKKKNDTNLVDIVAINHSPQLAKEIANTVANKYIAKYVESSNKNWNRLIEQMNTKLNEAKKELDTSRQMLYKNESKEGINTAFGSLLLGGGVTQSGTQYMAEIPQAVATLKSNIMQMEITLESLRKKLPEANPQIINLKNQIAETKQKLSQEESKLLEKYNKQFGLSELAAKVVFNQQMYAMLVAKQEEFKAQYMMQNKTPEIIEEAIEPMLPFSPKKGLILAMGLFMGVIFGLAFAILMELLNNKINIIDDSNQYEKIPILGKIPKIKFAPSNYKKLLISNNTNQNWIEEYYKASYKLLRTEIISSLTNEGDNSKGRAIMITSSMPKEGKSLLSANLAISLSEAGYKALLIDLNQQYPFQESLFDIVPKSGLVDVLMEKNSWNDAICITGINNLDIITPGDKQYDLSGLLISEKMTNFIDELKNKYDYIIFDSTSIMLSSDSLAVGLKIDGAVLILRAEYSKKDIVAKSIQKLQDNKTNLLGIVVSCITPDRKYRKYYK